MNNKKAIIISTITVLLFVMVVGVAYAFFSYESGERSEIVTGQIYMDYKETSTISLSNMWPETKTQALARTDEKGVFEFTITGQNTSKYPIYYEIDLLDGGVITGKTAESTKILPEHVRVYLERDGDVLIDGVTFADWNSRRVYVDTVPAGTANRIDYDYVLRIWIDENVTISDTDTSADYTTSEWNDSYVSLKVRVYGDFEEKTMPTAADTIIASLGSNGLVAVADDGGLYTGDESQVIREYRYSGSDDVVNKNYVWFNDELWRIIGVFPTEKEDGTTENLIKIIKATPLEAEEIPTTYTYNGVSMTLKRNDADDTAYWNGEKYFGQTNNNDWTKASLQYYLNDEATGSASYYNSIGSTYQGMIQETTYYLGNVCSEYDSAEPTESANIYTEERTSQVASNEIMINNFWEGNSFEWRGKIGLIYPSDYLYAGINEVNYDNNWLVIPSYTMWTISNFGRVNDTIMVLADWGGVYGQNLMYSQHVLPVLYLKSDVMFVDGTGIDSDPYKLG